MSFCEKTDMYNYFKEIYMKKRLNRTLAFLLSLMTVFTAVCVMPVKQNEVKAAVSDYIEYINPGTASGSYTTARTITIKFNSQEAVNYFIGSGNNVTAAYDSSKNALRITTTGSSDPNLMINLAGKFSTQTGCTALNDGYLYSNVNAYYSIAYRCSDANNTGIKLYYVSNQAGIGEGSNLTVTQAITSDGKFHNTSGLKLYNDAWATAHGMTGIRLDLYEGSGSSASSGKNFYVYSISFSIPDSVNYADIRASDLADEAERNSAAPDTGSYIFYSSSKTNNVPNTVTIAMNSHADLWTKLSSGGTLAYDSTYNALKLTVGSNQPNIKFDFQNRFSDLLDAYCCDDLLIGTGFYTSASVIYRFGKNDSADIGKFNVTGRYSCSTACGGPTHNSDLNSRRAIDGNYISTATLPHNSGVPYRLYDWEFKPYNNSTVHSGDEMYIYAIVFGVSTSACETAAESYRKRAMQDFENDTKITSPAESGYIVYRDSSYQVMNSVSNTLPSSVTVKLNGTSVTGGSDSIIKRFSNDAPNVYLSESGYDAAEDAAKIVMTTGGDPWVSLSMFDRFGSLVNCDNYYHNDIYKDASSGGYQYMSVVYKFNTDASPTVATMAAFYVYDGNASDQYSASLMQSLGVGSVNPDFEYQYTSAVQMVGSGKLSYVRIDPNNNTDTRYGGGFPNDRDTMYIYAVVFGVNQTQCNEAARLAAQEANAPKTDPALAFATVQVTLRDDIQMDFTVAQASDFSNFEVHVIDSAGTETVCTAKSPHNGDSVSYVYSNLSPQRADEPFTAYVVATKNGRTYNSVQRLRYSLKQYCNDRLSVASGTEVTLLVDILNYCEAARLYDSANQYSSTPINSGSGGTSGHDTLSDLSAATYYVLDEDFIASDSKAVNAVSGTGGSVSWNKVTVSLKDCISIRFSATGDIGTATVTVSGSGTAPEANKDPGLNEWIIPVCVVDMDKVFTITGTNTNSFTFSVDSYYYYVLSHTGEYPVELVNLVRAMMRYGYSAKQYTAGNHAVVASPTPLS